MFLLPTEAKTPQETFDSGPNLVAQGNWAIITVGVCWTADTILFAIKIEYIKYIIIEIKAIPASEPVHFLWSLW